MGSLGTVLTFWCIGYFSSSVSRLTVRLNPEMEDALIQAGYGRPDASGELPGSVQLTRTQKISVMEPIMASVGLHIGDSGTIYHIDDCCLSYPDKVLSICQVCNNSSSAFEIGRSVFVFEQGQKFHLSRYCRTFKTLPVTE